MGQQVVALCADETSLTHPETIGLAGENLQAQQWLRLFTSAEAARAALRIAHDIQEVWVVTCDTVAPINLAATLKADRPDRPVYMLTFQGSGSLNSRSVTAGINGQLSTQAFVTRYAQWKQRAMAMSLGTGVPQVATTGVTQASTSMGAAQAPVAARVPQATMGVGGSVAGVTQASTGAGAPQMTVGAPQATVGTPQMSAATNAPSVAVAPAVQSALALATAQVPVKTSLVPVVSGSGGAGKSTVAALLAQVASASGIKTLLVDYDLQFGDMAHFLGDESPVRIDELLANPALVSRVSAQGTRPAFLAAPKHIEEASVVSERAGDLLQIVSGHFDLIVFNTGAFWAEQHAALLERATKAVFLIDQRSSSLRACQHALDMCARLGIASGPFSFVLNKCTKGSPFTAIDASCALRGAHVYELRDGGSEVDELMESAMMPVLLEENNVLADDVRDLLAELLPTLGLVSQGSDAGPGLANLLSKRSRKRKRSA